jgi:23S rRNA (pseudouridine1915-N3)-methyltransferase
MKLSLLCVGRIKANSLRTACADYHERLRRYGMCDVIEVRAAHPKNDSAEALRRAISEESAALIAAAGKIGAQDVVFVLDERGVQCSSAELAARFSALERNAVKRAAFVIGGAFGLSDSARRLGRLWSLSKLTLPHELCRLLLLEQLYRARTIQRGEPYHHA